MNDLTPAEQRLADQLQRQASSLDVGDTAVATVVRRGQLRRDRRKAGVSVLAVLALSATVIGSIQILSRPDRHKIIASTDSEPGGETVPAVPVTTVPGAAIDELAPVNRVDSNLVWNAVEPGSSESLGGMSFINGASGYQAKPPYLAWSTAAGRTQTLSPQLWRSDDGIHWQVAQGSTFKQPEVQANGLGALNGRLLAFGTAAATAPIPKGTGGDLVVDVSDDQGGSWRHVVLPVDLRGLAKMDGVQFAGYSGAFAVSSDAAVAIAQPMITLSPEIMQRYAGGFATSRKGLTPITYPSCAYPGGVAPTTISFGVQPTVVEGTAPADTILVGPTTTFTPTGTIPADPTGCTVDTTPQQGGVVPWSDLGVDQRVVDAMFTPRVFASTDGDTFTEGVFPPPPDGYQPGAPPQLFATSHGFVAFAQFYDLLGAQSVTNLYTSTDGLSWTENDVQIGAISALQALDDGTLVAFGQDPTPYPNSTWVASSTDGKEWTKRSLRGLVEPADGTTAILNVWQMAAGPNGLTALGNIETDAAAEAGGFSVEKDGVRLTLTASRFGSMVATDIASGKELGRFDGQTPPATDAALSYAQDGGMRVLADDGSLRVAFSGEELQQIYMQQNVSGSKLVILHSTDGVNWSRDDVEPLTGFNSMGGGRIMATASNVLVSVVKSIPYNSDGTSTQPGAIPKTVVLVGTPKS